MPIKATQLSIKLVFEQNHTFQVPKYQRGYAWDEDAVSDFIDDIGRCLKTRSNTAPQHRHHFFGGLVTVKQDVPHSNRTNYEVIDGQQRLASFVMLVAAVIRGMSRLLAELTQKVKLNAEEKKAKSFLETTIDTLRSLYIVYKDNIDLEYIDVPKLTLSQADNDFFQQVIGGEQGKPQRASHERIQAAWDRLCNFVETVVINGGSTSDRAKRFQVLVNTVLVEDCTAIFMSSDTRAEAYQIFQVLNDRGVHLTDGDLLRATTMELLDHKDLLSMQGILAKHWDRVLAYPPNDIDSYLRWYYSSHEGKRPKSSNIADQFLEQRFGHKDQAPVGKQEAKSILAEVQRMDDEFALLETLGGGDWPYLNDATVTGWDRERLRMLISDLKHTNAMPVLLALRLLDAKKFAEAVSSIERFVFRYKTIGNAHISSMSELYMRHAKEIRKDKAKYSVGGLKAEMKALVQKVVPDSVFETNLLETRYSQRAGNGHIRYLLITLEDYSAWYEQGAQGNPKCKDKTRVFDSSNTTLEHLYPQGAETKDKEAQLEVVKHELGNLTIFGPTDNDKLANKSFPEKRKALESSNIKLNREVGKKTTWSADDVRKRTQVLAKMAVKVFIP
jgi:hypothetical protein